MKHYPQKYANVLVARGFDTLNGFESTLGEVEDYILMLQKAHHEMSKDIFKHIVQMYWLSGCFVYRGRRRSEISKNGMIYERAWSTFNYLHIGHVPFAYNKIEGTPFIGSYIGELLPNFLFDNPFTSPEKFEYRWKNLSVDYLIFVAEVENRIELLDYADSINMPFLVFVNWATNWILSHNDEIGINKYAIRTSRHARQTLRRIVDLERLEKYGKDWIFTHYKVESPSGYPPMRLNYQEHLDYKEWRAQNQERTRQIKQAKTPKEKQILKDGYRPPSYFPNKEVMAEAARLKKIYGIKPTTK
jgi:hypothetical protein